MGQFIPSGRDARIDLLRTLAMIQVVFMHALQLHSISEETLNFIVLYIPDTAGLYFLASGMFIFPISRHSQTSPWRYVLHRIWSILPEFIIFSALYVGLDAYYGTNPTDLDGWARLCWMFVRPTWGPGWFILALVGLYAVSPIISAWIENARKRDVEIVLVMWLVTCFVPLMTPYVEVDIPRTAFGTLFNYAGFMLLGYYLQKWPLSDCPRYFRAGYFGLAVFGGIVCTMWLAPRALEWGYLPNLANGLCINIVLVVALETGLVMMLKPTSIPRWIQRASTFISVCSLGFYCSHWYFVWYLGRPLGWSYITTVIVTLVGSIFVAAVMRYIRCALTTDHRRHDG